MKPNGAPYKTKRLEKLQILGWLRAGIHMGLQEQHVQYENDSDLLWLSRDFSS